jgi:hypothetical protein
MTKLVEDKLERIRELCAEFHVRRLALFGSAVRDDFDPGRSDIDFVVEFERMDPVDHMRAYFGLAEELKALFQTDVDLIERAPIRNPYFLREIEDTQAVVYDAA